MQPPDLQRIELFEDDLNTRLAPLTKRLHLGLTALIDASLQDLELTATQFSALVLLSVGRASVAAELARIIGISDQAAGGLVDRLENRGALQRRPHPEDRRRHVLHVTDSGRSLLSDATGRVEAAENSALKQMSVNQRQALLDGLKEAVKSVDGWRARQ